MFNSMLMRNMMETGQPDSCPRATQDLELNLKNRQNFRSRHGCDKAKDKLTAKYWSCYQWRAGSKVKG